jgi:hypothetical protein
VAVREMAPNSAITDEIIGFHAQQATRGSGDLPVDVDAVIGLTQYAVPLRYDELLDAEPLDREATVALVNSVEQWANTVLDPAA